MALDGYTDQTLSRQARAAELLDAGTEAALARAWRDQRLLRLGGGTSETMRYYIAKIMGF
jgi:alkylation response protein AidB-like acyl-CoA dehydrogenase